VKILLVTSDAYGCSGGIAQYNRDLVEALAGLPGVRQVTVLARNLRTAVGTLPPKVVFNASAAGGVGAFLRAALAQALPRHDLVICGHVNLVPVVAALALRSCCPWVLMAYGIEVWAPPAQRLVRGLARCATAVWTISEFTRQRASAWLSVREATDALLPNAIRPEAYAHAQPSHELVEHFRGPASHVVLTLGRLVASERYKGVDEMLEVLPSLLQVHPQIRYVVAGDGDDRARLQAKAVALGVQDHVLFVGFIPEDQKAGLYRLADVFAMPGRGEGFGFVFLEALACGTPVVASTLDGSFEAVRHGQIGLAVDPDDREALRAALLAALAGPREVPAGLAYFAFEAFQARLAEAMSRLRLPTYELRPFKETP
jgi:phosphatidylinositol alpha-1,6-mannosyltransferase